MKNQTFLKKTVIWTAAILWIWAVPQLAEDLKDQPDSLRYVMGINVDDSVVEELPGDSVKRFRLYTLPERSTILWRYGKHYYYYNFREGGHLLRATALFDQLRQNGLTSFVAKRKGNTVKFHEYRQVLAIQVSS